MSVTHEMFDQLSLMCERCTGREWDGTMEHLAQATHLQSVFLEVLEVHAAWLRSMREAAESQGRPWTQSELLRQSRRVDGLTTPRDDQVDWQQAAQR